MFESTSLNAQEIIPAVNHLGTARIQTVRREHNPLYHQLIKWFGEATGVPILLNTSFNVRGEPIVCTPDDAYRCFMRTEMDYLVIENWMFTKAEQPSWSETDDWASEFTLD